MLQRQIILLNHNKVQQRHYLIPTMLPVSWGQAMLDTQVNHGAAEVYFPPATLNNRAHTSSYTETIPSIGIE